MIKKYIALITLCFTAYHTSYSQTKGDKLFDATFMHELRFYSDSEPDLFFTMQDDALASFMDRPNHMVKMVFDGEVVDSVAIRAKGYSSSTIPQTPYKIDLNEYVDDQSFDGIKKFNLTNSFLDQYRQRDRVCYELFRRAGIPSPKTAYTEVYINDEFIDVYLLVQQIDKTFIMENYAEKGSLQKFDSGTIYGPDVFSTAYILGNVDQRHFYKFLLVNYIVRAMDNYPTNNYYIYYSEKADDFYFLPWDYNLTLDAEWTNGNSSIKPNGGGPFIWDTPELKSVYLEIACELNDYLFDEIENLVQNNEDVITSNSQGATVASHSALLTYLLGRKQWLEDELIFAESDCVTLSYPHEHGDLVINEFVSSNDSNGGVQEPDGGTPDWIELYNNTDQDITLDHHYYLSDDVDFPKKWNFKTAVVIPAYGYQIIWADRDIHQQGVHSNFKLNKSRGDILLVYEDLTTIDQVSYESQELNKGYARVPNGTGEFTIQDYTFNSTNEITSSINKLGGKISIDVYPNPARNEISITCIETINLVTLYAYNGYKIKTHKTNDKYVRLDIESLPTGIYFIHVSTNGQNEIVKFVKE